MRCISPTLGEAYSPAEGLCGAPLLDVGPYRKSRGLSGSSPGESGQPATRKLLGMRVIQGPFGEKDFKLFFRTDPGFSLSCFAARARLTLRLSFGSPLREEWQNDVLVSAATATPIQSRTSFSASPGTTKDARKIGKGLFPVHRKATVSPSAASKSVNAAGE